MKKLFLLITIAMLFCNSAAFASNIEAQATMFSRSNIQDRVWVGTFQLVWNDFIEKFVHNIVRFREGTPVTAQELNLQTFTSNDISDRCFYKMSGRITKNTKKEIAKAIKKKFNETSDILESLDLTPGADRFIIYAMLKKDFEFLNEFNKLGNSKFGNLKDAEYFGINKNSDSELKDGVKVLFYNNKNDYAVVLLTKSKDEVYLYKNSANKSFYEIYGDMNKKAKKYKGETALAGKDELKVPKIKFDVTKNFDELTNKRVMGTNMVIGQALETVKFNMDNKGVELKSEAAMTMCLTSLNAKIEEPRYFYFDDTFFVFLQEKGKKNPYFALRVNDISKFQ